MATTKTNKTAFILSFPTSMSAADVIARGKSKGIKLTDRYIYSARSKAKMLAAAGKVPGKRGRPRKDASANGGSARSGTPTSAEMQFMALVVVLGVKRSSELIERTRTLLIAA